MNPTPDLRSLSSRFQITGDFITAEPYGSGHINDTYRATYNQGGTVVHYLHQRINQNVFRQPVAVMENIARVTAHLQSKLTTDRSRRALTLIPTREGQLWHCDDDARYWRTYIFIEDARTFDAVESPQQAFEAGRAFGRFQQALADLPSPRLHDTIPAFHDTPKRFQALEHAIQQDVANRAASVRDEIVFALHRRALSAALLSAGLPERITHNDTKFNNVMLDDATGEGLCVIDLDTVMPGLALYDFGDMVRTTTSPAREDEQDLSKVTMQRPLFEALARGYLSAASAFLTKSERTCLVTAGQLITFEIGIRFLTDYLAGDTYFKVHRAGHNLDRCRTQFKLVESIEQQAAAMQKIVDDIS